MAARRVARLPLLGPALSAGLQAVLECPRHQAVLRFTGHSDRSARSAGSGHAPRPARPPGWTLSGDRPPRRRRPGPGRLVAGDGAEQAGGHGIVDRGGAHRPAARRLHVVGPGAVALVVGPSARIPGAHGTAAGPAEHECPDTGHRLRGRAGPRVGPVGRQAGLVVAGTVPR